MLFRVTSAQTLTLDHISLPHWSYRLALSDLSTYLHQLSLGLVQAKLWTLHHSEHRLLTLFSMFSDPMPGLCYSSHHDLWSLVTVAAHNCRADILKIDIC